MHGVSPFVFMTAIFFLFAYYLGFEPTAMDIYEMQTSLFS